MHNEIARGHEENEGSNGKRCSTHRVREHRKRATLEEKANTNAARREKRSHESVEEKGARLEKRRKQRASELGKESPEDRAKRLSNRRQKDKEKRDMETNEERETRLKKRQLGRRKKLHKCIDCNTQLPKSWLAKPWKMRCWGCWKTLDAMNKV